MVLPLTLSWSWTGAGPMATALAWPAASSAAGARGAWARAVAAAAAPEPLRNARRDIPGPFLLCPCGSVMVEDPSLVKKEYDGEQSGVSGGIPSPAALDR